MHAIDVCILQIQPSWLIFDKLLKNWVRRLRGICSWSRRRCVGDSRSLTGASLITLISSYIPTDRRSKRVSCQTLPHPRPRRLLPNKVKRTLVKVPEKTA